MAKEGKLIGAEELVGLIGYAGPGKRVPVRIHSRNGKEIGTGTTNWSDDRVPGPIVAFTAPKEKEGWLIPLGGEIRYANPPRVSSGVNVRRTGMVFGEIDAQQMPTNPMAESYQFEVLEEKKA